MNLSYDDDDDDDDDMRYIESLLVCLYVQVDAELKRRLDLKLLLFCLYLESSCI